MLGGDNKLAVGLMTYEPGVRCEGHHIRIDSASCTSIKYTMHASSEQKRFGDARLTPGVQVRLPYAMVDGTYAIQTGLFYLQCHQSNPMVRDIGDAD